MQLEFGHIDLFSLEPVDERLRNFSKKTLNFKEAVEEQRELEKQKGASREALKNDETQKMLGTNSGTF